MPGCERLMLLLGIELPDRGARCGLAARIVAAAHVAVRSDVDEQRIGIAEREAAAAVTARRHPSDDRVRSAEVSKTRGIDPVAQHRGWRGEIKRVPLQRDA